LNKLVQPRRKPWRRLRRNTDMAKDVISEQDEKLLAFYSGMNVYCREKLAEFRRTWLDVAGTLPFYRGDVLPVSKIEGVYPIKSIFYSDKVAHAQVVYELMKAMHAWVMTNASDRQSVLFVISGSTDRVALLANTTSTHNGKSSLEAAFPGVVFGDPRPLSPYVENMRRGGLVTGIPAFSENEHEQLYSLDVLLRGLRGKRFTIVIAGVPCTEAEVDQYLSETRQEIGNNHENIKQNITKQFGEGVSKTLGTSFTSFGALMSSLSKATTKTISGGLSFPIKRVIGTVAGSLAKTITKTTGHALGSAIGVNYSVTRMQNRSHANSLERLNQFAEAYEEALEERETRYQNALAEGAWRSLTYVLAENDEDFKFASALLKSCLTAHFDVYEPFRIVPLGNVSSDWESSICTLPEVSYKGQRRKLETILTSSEFASLISLPSESQPGIEVRETPRFSVTAEAPEGERIALGSICDREVVSSNVMAVAPSDLLSHTLVVGLTGMGKSTTIRRVLSEAHVPFLVIEPAKSEYRNMLVGGEHIRVFTAGDEDVLPIRINPFEIPPGDSLHSHIDALGAILNAAFPMEGPMSALLEQGLVRAYQDAGWDVVQGKAPNDNRIPTMDDFYRSLEKTIDEQHFQGDYGCNIKSALLARINSLRIGPRGRLFNSELPFDVGDLLSRPTVIEMKKVGSDETKTFLSGLLLLRLYKFFEQQGLCDRLQNLLVIEEAHRIFRKASDKGNSLVGNNSAHQSVQLFENILAEVRAYGLGIVIADQLPLRLSDGAVKNTNLKIIHRLGALDDAIAMGGSMGLDEKRATFICRMNRGEALVHCASVSEPAHVKVAFCKDVVGELLTEDYLKQCYPREKTSERRPPYFDTVRSQLEICRPRGLETVADACLFSILMVPAVKREKWEYIWNASTSRIIEELGKPAHVSVSQEMAAHLLHASVLSLLKGWRGLMGGAAEAYLKILRAWDVVLGADGCLNLEKIREVRDLIRTDEVTKQAKWPLWVPTPLPSVERHYLEARQMAAVIKLRAPEVVKALAGDELPDACARVTRAILDRTVPEVDVRGETLRDFTISVLIALVDVVRPQACAHLEYIAGLIKEIEDCYQEKGVGR